MDNIKALLARYGLELLILVVLLLAAWWWLQPTGQAKEVATLSQAPGTDVAADAELDVEMSTSTESTLETEVDTDAKDEVGEATEASSPEPPAVTESAVIRPPVPSPVVEPVPEPVIPPADPYSLTTAHRSTLLATHNQARANKGVGALSWSGEW